MNTQIFENIRTMKRQLLPKDRVILFGSQARGDAHWDSDWDLLVLLNKKKKTSQDEGTSKNPYRHAELVSTSPAKMHLTRGLRVKPSCVRKK